MQNITALFKPAIFGLFLVSTAAYSATPSITVGSGAGQVNTEVTIGVSFENTSGGDVVGLQFDIGFDSANLTADVTACGAGLPAISCSIPSAGTVRVIGDGSLNTIASGSLGSIGFTIANNNALIGTTEALEVTNALFSNDQGNPITAGTLTDGVVTIQAAPAPAISVSPTSATIAAANGSTNTQTFTVTNSGNDDGLLVNAPTIVGTNAANFTVTSNTCPTAAPGVAEDGTCSIVVTFAPNSVASFSATLNITSNGGSSSIALTGTGTLGPVGAITVTPASTFDFGELLTGEEDATQVFTATNTGAAGSTVTISSAALNTSGAPFTITANTCAATTELDKDESCAVTVKFEPAADGEATRTLTVSGTDANSTALTGSSAMKGTGISEARPTANPASGASESEVVGPEGSNDFTVVFGNTGNISYDVACSLASTDNTSVWSVANGGTTTVAAGASHTVTTTCALPDTETYTATLSCAIGSTQTFTYSYECVGLPPLPVPVDNKWALLLLALMMLMAASFGFRFMARQ